MALVIRVQLPNDGLFIQKPRDLPKAGAERHETFVVSGRKPIGRNDWRRSQKPPVLHIVGNEIFHLRSRPSQPGSDNNRRDTNRKSIPKRSPPYRTDHIRPEEMSLQERSRGTHPLQRWCPGNAPGMYYVSAAGPALCLCLVIQRLCKGPYFGIKQSLSWAVGILALGGLYELRAASVSSCTNEVKNRLLCGAVVPRWQRIVRLSRCDVPASANPGPLSKPLRVKPIPLRFRSVRGGGGMSPLLKPSRTAGMARTARFRTPPQWQSFRRDTRARGRLTSWPPKYSRARRSESARRMIGT